MHLGGLSDSRGPRRPRQSSRHRTADTRRYRWHPYRGDRTPFGDSWTRAVGLGNDRWREPPIRLGDFVPLLFVVPGHSAWLDPVHPRDFLERMGAWPVPGMPTDCYHSDGSGQERIPPRHAEPRSVPDYVHQRFHSGDDPGTRRINSNDRSLNQGAPLV
jgi:hypothetical protein